MLFFVLVQILFHFPGHYSTVKPSFLVAGDPLFIVKSFNSIRRILWPARNPPSLLGLIPSPVKPQSIRHLNRNKALLLLSAWLLVDGVAAELKSLSVRSTSVFGRRLQDPVSELGRTAFRERERKKFSWAWPSFLPKWACYILRVLWASSPLTDAKTVGFQATVFSLCVLPSCWFIGTSHLVRHSPPPPTSVGDSVSVTTDFETPADHLIFHSAYMAVMMVAKGLVRFRHPISRSSSRSLAWTSSSPDFTWHRGMTRSLVFLNRYTSSICRGLTSKNVLVKIQVLVDFPQLDFDRSVLLVKLPWLISAGAYSKHLGRKGHIFSPSLFKKRVLFAISSHWERSLPLSSLLRERIFPPPSLVMRAGLCPVVKPRIPLVLLTVLLSFVEIFSRSEDAVGIIPLIPIGLVVVSKSHNAENAVTTPQLTVCIVVRPEFSLASRISTSSDTRVNTLSNSQQFVYLSPLMFSSFVCNSASRLAYWVCPIMLLTTCNL